MPTTRFPVNLGGHDYLTDLSLPIGSAYSYRRESAVAQRDQQNRQDVVSEQTIVRDDLWRRSQESWIGGAGQSVFDRETSTAIRFRSSKGIDPWTEWQLSLLPQTVQKRTSANTNLQLLVAYDRIYLIDGTTLYRSTDLSVASPTWTAVFFAVPSGSPVIGPPVSIATDGQYVYIAAPGGTGAGIGIWRHDRNTTTSATWSALAATILGFVKGRLMAAVGFRLYNVTGPTTQVELTPATFNADWVWDAFGEGPGSILAAGHSGDKASIYKIGVTAEGSNLTAPTHAAELPTGEIVYSLSSYLGTVIIGTSKGVRLGLVSGGDIVIGPLIATPSPVRCFEAHDRFVWFGWTNYDTVSTGLGRTDLLTFTKPITPAFASDLMTTGQGIVSGVVTFQDRRVFCVNGSGVFRQDTTLVASGTVESGLITYGVQQPKIALAADLRHRALAGRIELSLSADGDTFDDAAQSDAQGELSSDVTLIEPPVRAGSTLESRITLYRSVTDTMLGPTLIGWTVMSQPTPHKAEIITVPILLHEELVTADGEVVPVDPEEEFDFLKGLERDGRPVDYREGRKVQKVVVEDVVFLPRQSTEDGEFSNGLVVVRLKAFA